MFNEERHDMIKGVNTMWARLSTEMATLARENLWIIYELSDQFSCTVLDKHAVKIKQDISIFDSRALPDQVRSAILKANKESDWIQSQM